MNLSGKTKTWKLSLEKKYHKSDVNFLQFIKCVSPPHTYICIVSPINKYTYTNSSSSSGADSMEFLTPPLSLSLSSIAPGRSSQFFLYPHRTDVSFCWSANTSTSKCKHPSENVAYHLVLASPECLVRFTSMVCEMGGSWPYNCCFVRYCFHDLFKTAPSIFVQFPSDFFPNAFF